MNKFFEELKRRNVIKGTIAYIVVAWVLLQVASVVLPIANAPEWVLKTFTFFLAIGFPVWLFFSWVYEVTPEGLKKTAQVSVDDSITAKTNKRLNVLILVGLALAILVGLLNKPSFNSGGNSFAINENIENSIAVLPFDDMSSGSDSQWFCDGVTEDILTHLSKVKGLRVISRTSVMNYRGSDKKIPEIAKELGVSYVVEGSVKKHNNDVVITAQLIKSNDEHLWADNYKGTMDDVFKLQGDVSKQIVQQLKITLSPDEEEILNKRPTESIEAYQLFLKGRSIADTRTKEDLEKSIELYQQALNIDPNYADAYAEIANSINLLVAYGGKPVEEANKEAKIFIDKALAIDPNTVRAYTVQANIYLEQGEFDNAKENYEKAIAINPNDATAHHHFAIYYRELPETDIENFLIQINEAHRLDPLSNPIIAVKLHALLDNNKLDEAKLHFDKSSINFTNSFKAYNEGRLNSLIHKNLIEHISSLKRALEKDPNNPELHSALRGSYSNILNDNINSLKHAKKAYELEPSNSAFLRAYIYSLYANKQFDIAKKLIDTSDVILINERRKIVLLQDYYAYQGKYDMAISYLEKLKPIDIDNYYYQKAWLYSRMRDAKTTNQVLSNSDFKPSNRNKVLFYAQLKATDSVFYYLDKISNQKNLSQKLAIAMNINGSDELDYYRDDPRYIEFLKNHYIPVSE